MLDGIRLWVRSNDEWLLLLIGLLLVFINAIIMARGYERHEEEVKKIVRETIREELKDGR